MAIWRCEPVDPGPIETLARSLQIPAAAATVLWRRGLDSGSASGFLDPRLAALGDPFDLPDMDRAVDRLWRAIDAGERITVFGDYDADGVTAAALAVEILKALGARVSVHLPLRLDEGYGLSLESLQRCLDETRPELLLTVDCGSCSAAAVDLARRRDVDVVVTDHHVLLGPPAPALAVVNPQRTDAAPVPEAARGLAGVGVAFKLGHALLKRGRALGHAVADALDLRIYLDWVAIGTVADVAPLLGENRILVAAGLKTINTTPGPAVQALMAAAGIRPPVTTRQIAFGLAPRLNAAGRLGDAGTALDLLLTNDPADAARLAGGLDQVNRERRILVEQTTDAAERQMAECYSGATPFGIVVGAPDWPVGIVGITAARIAQRYHRPTVVVSFDEHGIGRGSARGIDEFNLLDGLRSCADGLITFGGHALAAGLSVAADAFDGFRRRFNEAAAAGLKDRDLQPALAIDAWLTPEQIDDRLLDVLEKMAPFGQGHPQPVWALRAARVAGASRVVGKNHLKLRIAAGEASWDAIGFNLGDRPVPEPPFDVAFHLERNEFRGRIQPQLVLQDLRAQDGGLSGP